MTNAPDLEALLSMRHGPISNYAIPGLTSWLISDPTHAGCVRLFECSRNHVEPITPHTHRFNFTAIVLSGMVTNRIWVRSDDGDEYATRCVPKQGAEPGVYGESIDGPVAKYSFHDTTYTKGDRYSMESSDFHSIYFSRDTRVLMFEGPQVQDYSWILEPVVGDKTLPLFRMEPWMFQKGSA